MKYIWPMKLICHGSFAFIPSFDSLQAKTFRFDSIMRQGLMPFWVAGTLKWREESAL